MTALIQPGTRAWDQVWDFRESDWRYEGLQDYDTDPEEALAFAEFRDGYRPTRYMKAWTSFVAAHVQAGRAMTRVRLIRQPVTWYTRFELTCSYPQSVAAGEDVRILSQVQARLVVLPRTDVHVFDRKRVMWMHYDVAGRFLGGEIDEDPGAARRLALTMDTVTRAAVPFGEYTREAAS